MIRDTILAGEYQPSAEEQHEHPLGMEKISQVWPKHPSPNSLNIFIRLPTSESYLVVSHLESFSLLAGALGKRNRPIDDPNPVKDYKIAKTAPSESPMAIETS